MRGAAGVGLPLASGARLRGAAGVGLPLASGGDAACFWVGGVGNRASGWRPAAAGVCIGMGPGLEASPMRTPLPKGSTA